VVKSEFEIVKTIFKTTRLIFGGLRHNEA